MKDIPDNCNYYYNIQPQKRIDIHSDCSNCSYQEKCYPLIHCQTCGNYITPEHGGLIYKNKAYCINEKCYPGTIMEFNKVKY